MVDHINQFGGSLFGGPVWPYAWLVVWSLIKIVVVVLPLMGCVAYLTLWERKGIGFTQIRPGPNRVGPFGLLTPIADAVKLIFKEIIRPTAANKGLFFLGPVMTIMPALAAWAVMPFGPEVALANINAGLLFLMAITSLEVYGVIIAGWASNSKYAFLGALRASAQMVSTRSPWASALVVVLMVRQHEHDRHRAEQGRAPCSDGPGLPVLELAAAAADVRRLLHRRPGRDQPPPVRRGRRRVRDRGRPHDRVLGHVVRDVLPGRIRQHDPGLDAVRDHVPGRLAAAVRLALDWIPGWIWLAIKVFVVVTMFLWVRATFPRYRYDQIMRLGWKIFIPVTLVWLVVVACGCRRPGTSGSTWAPDRITQGLLLQLHAAELFKGMRLTGKHFFPARSRSSSRKRRRR
jgi:NADH-quinone oxidoreductase subunit H